MKNDWLVGSLKVSFRLPNQDKDTFYAPPQPLPFILLESLQIDAVTGQLLPLLGRQAPFIILSDGKDHGILLKGYRWSATTAPLIPFLESEAVVFRRRKTRWEVECIQEMAIDLAGD
jgi:hypothetical protein